MRFTVVALLSCVIGVSACGGDNDSEGQSSRGEGENVATVDELSGIQGFLAESYSDTESVARTDLPNREQLIQKKGGDQPPVQAVEGVRTNLSGGNTGFVYRYETKDDAELGAGSHFGLTKPYGFVSGCGKNVYFTSRVVGREAERWMKTVASYLEKNDPGCRKTQFSLIE